jgi:lantibiotic modifying enzyme
MFTTRPGSRHLWTSVEGKVADFLEESGLARVQRRLGQFSETDLNKQLWFVRASLATLALREDEPKWPGYTPAEPGTSANPQRLLEAASAVGNHLEMLALRGKDDVSWLGLKLTSKRHWSLVPLESDLYAGIPGVLLFLAYLGAVTGEERYASLARAALATLRRQMEHSRPYLTSIGAFDGWGGIIYCLTHLGLL